MPPRASSWRRGGGFRSVSCSRLQSLSLAGAVAVVVIWRRRVELRPWLVVAAAAAASGSSSSAAVTQMHESGRCSVRLAARLEPADAPVSRARPPARPRGGVRLRAAALARRERRHRRRDGVRRGCMRPGGAASGSRLRRSTRCGRWPTGTVLGEQSMGERRRGPSTWACVLYTEPLSTALTTSALALLLSPAATELRLAVAGVALSLATVVKLSNAPARRGSAGLARRLATAPVALRAPERSASLPSPWRIWPLGYRAGEQDTLLAGGAVLAFVHRRQLARLDDVRAAAPDRARAARASRRARAIARGPRLLLAAWVLLPAAFYSFYRVTWVHPRFLFTALPALFVLWRRGRADARPDARAACPSCAVTSGRWLWALAVLAGVRIVIPLVALAASGDRLPGLPRYDFVALTGDATGLLRGGARIHGGVGTAPCRPVVAGARRSSSSCERSRVRSHALAQARRPDARGSSSVRPRCSGSSSRPRSRR